MVFPRLNQRILKRVYLVIIIFLAFGGSFIWQQIQNPFTQDNLMMIDRWENPRFVKEPIQPIPLNLFLNPSKVALGEKLFQEVRLSSDNQVSCVNCHDLSKGGADRRAYSVGVKGTIGKINSPTVFNIAYNFRFNWNGRFDSLSDHTDALLQNPAVMGSQWSDLLTKLRADSEYPPAFAQIYADGITKANVINAIVTYEKSLYTPNSRFDRYLRGDSTALTGLEKDGYRLFKAYGCVSCHQGVNVGGNMFQKFGVIGNYFADRGNITEADWGRFTVTEEEADRYVFRVPSLRNVAITAPYFHDGSAKTLEEAVSIMVKYQLGRPIPSDYLNLIVQFLHTLTGEYQGKPLNASANQ